MEKISKEELVRVVERAEKQRDTEEDQSAVQGISGRDGGQGNPKDTEKGQNERRSN